MKEVPLFLIVHNNLAKSNGNFILCTKKPAYLSKILQFDTQEDLNTYIETTSKEYQIVPNTNELLEIVSFFDNIDIDLSMVEKTFKRMAHWYAHHGEKEA